MHISLFIIATCLLAAEMSINTYNNTYAKQAENETVDNKLLVEVTLRLEGKTVPGEPKVVSAKNKFDALYEKTSGKPLELKKMGKDTWRCYGVDGEKYVIGWIAKKGWFAKRSKMFGYCSEPFTARDGLTMKFSPGMPATFEYDLRNPPEGVKTTPARVVLLREIIQDGKRSFLFWGGETRNKEARYFENNRIGRRQV